jgi:alpha-L-arabinofuranosidase
MKKDAMRRAVMLVSALIVSGRASAVTSIRIDADKVKAPISKYIYGQFIEHLGHCIYGGIWAEMLQDRKFYYPITDDYNPWGTASDPFWKAGEYNYLNASPWKVIGPGKSVFMDSSNAYVGAHSPVIRLPGDGTEAGISQDGLVVSRDRRYTGRILIAGDKEAAPVRVRLVLNGKTALTHEIRAVGPGFRRSDFEFTVPSTDDNARLEIVSRGKGRLRIGTVSLMPADNLNGWRKDVVGLLKELGSPIYRWPGGNFVSGYDWRDGIGERDRRAPRKNPAWKGIEHNDVGIHEFMDLMKRIRAEAYVAVNTGLGTVEEVAREVEYCNGTEDTPMGKLRARNGHPEPYRVKWWAVGNEMYGDWQLGHMPLSEYVKKHISVARAMTRVDPAISLVGVGSAGEWSETMLRECSDYMTLISEHVYCQEKPDVAGHARQLSEEIGKKADAHRKYRAEIGGLAGKNIRIAMDEWNYWYGDYLYGELGVRYHLKDALGVAMGLHEYFRNSDLYFMANYAQTVNVIGCIKATPAAAAFETTGLVLKLYRSHFGSLPVDVSGSSPNLDVSAALTEDKKILSVAFVNPADTGEKVNLDFGKTRIGNGAKTWVIMHKDPEAYNEPGKKPNVIIREKDLSASGGEMTVPAYSIVLVNYKIINNK